MTPTQQIILSVILIAVVLLEVYSRYTFKRIFEKEKKEVETSEIWKLISKNEYLRTKCTLSESGIYFRCDVATTEDFSGQDEYDTIREELYDLGLQLVDLCIEHDCVSGYVGKLT